MTSSNKRQRMYFGLGVTGTPQTLGWKNQLLVVISSIFWEGSREIKLRVNLKLRSNPTSSGSTNKNDIQDIG